MPLRFRSLATLALVLGCAAPGPALAPAARSTAAAPAPRAPEIGKPESDGLAPPPEGAREDAAELDELAAGAAARLEPSRTRIALGLDLRPAAPADAGLDAAVLARIDAAVGKAIDGGELPGAVVLVARRGRVVLRKAYGSQGTARALAAGEDRAMAVGELFDLASVTKLATALAVMVLVERGRLRLDDRAAAYVPALSGPGKDAITIEELLVHTSGLPADNPLADYARGREAALAAVFAQPLVARPGERELYSDLGYVILGEIVERLSGQRLDAFLERELFGPLGMRDTGFRPAPALAARAAPTGRRDGRWLRGEVHDPRAHLLGGVAGHAGLFSTADDLARLGRALLSGGGGVLRAETVREMLRPRKLPGGGLRALGWDVRGSLLGHLGFTGTAFWIDPSTGLSVVFLSNRVHPDGRGDVNALRAEVREAAAAAVIPATAVVPGVEVLRRDGFARLRGKRIGVCTHAPAVARDGTPTLELLERAEGVTLVRVFTPEHGLEADADEAVADGARRPRTVSLYGPRRRPRDADLADLDALVVDLVDVGARFYTYETTLLYLLEAAAARGLEVIVLDRPNPIGGVRIEGPLLDPALASFTGAHPLPVRHALTLGELGRLFDGERRLGAKLTVIPAEGWRPGDLADATGLPFVPPSPNIRRLEGALLYPGIGPLETTSVSVGRGTDRPFEIVGAPYVDGAALARALASERLGGVRFTAVTFTPRSSTHAGKACGGVAITIEDRDRLEPFAVGIAVARALRTLHPREWDARPHRRLVANGAFSDAFERGASLDDLGRLARADSEVFARRRAQYLLYPR